MLTHKESLSELRERFKLNIYEAKIWTSLLSRGVAAASELADISGVPRSRCYDVLESLEKKGFIIMKIGKPIKYIAVQPEAVVDRVKKRLHDEAQTQIAMVEKIGDTDMFRELELLHKTGVQKVDVENVTDSIVGRSSINRFIKEMLLRAKENVTILTNAEGIKHKARALKKARKSLEKNKVHVKVYTNGMQKTSVDLGAAEILTTNHLVRLVNVDNKEALFIIPAKHHDFDSAIWVSSKHFVTGLNFMFNNSK